jgi:hypothetical protein
MILSWSLSRLQSRYAGPIACVVSQSFDKCRICILAIWTYCRYITSPPGMLQRMCAHYYRKPVNLIGCVYIYSRCAIDGHSRINLKLLLSTPTYFAGVRLEPDSEKYKA